MLRRPPRSTHFPYPALFRSFEPGQAPPGGGDSRLQLNHHLLRRLARVDSPVDLDLAAVWHDVWARAAVDRAHGQAGRPERWVTSTPELLANQLELERDPRGRRDRVASKRRR